MEAGGLLIWYRFLKEQHIAFIVDVRRFPRSTVPEYNRENLETKLPQFGISYIFMGDIPWVDSAEVATANIQLSLRGVAEAISKGSMSKLL